MTLIRSAYENDISVLHKFLYNLAVFQNFEDNFVITEKELENLIFKDGVVSVIVIEEDDEIIGVCFYYFKVSTFSGRKILYIEDIIISEEKRNSGYGKMVFEFLEKIAQSNKCTSMEWKCLADNENAKKAYASYGGRIDSDMINYYKKIM